MKLYNKVKNNVEYYKWSKIRKESLEKMKEHLEDEDQTEYKFWYAQCLLALKKCREIEI